MEDCQSLVFQAEPAWPISNICHMLQIPASSATVERRKLYEVSKWQCIE